jgi:hypothetical protein
VPEVVTEWDRARARAVIRTARRERPPFGPWGCLTPWEVELQVEIVPFANNAGSSPVIIWNSDGSDDDQVIDSGADSDGWRVFIKLAQRSGVRLRSAQGVRSVCDGSSPKSIR